MKPGKFNVLFDSAWGSSAKGAAAARLADIFGIQNASSSNYPNAGHTVIFGGVKIVFKALPSPAALLLDKDRKIRLWIGPNSGFFKSQLDSEILSLGRTNAELITHDRAVLMDQRHIDAESPGGSQSTLHVSSTMSGSGAAYAEKAMRGKLVSILGNDDSFRKGEKIDFYDEVRSTLRRGEQWLHEVSQGWALSINCGTHYPNCTFRDCTPQQAYADFCITPELVGDVYMNIRTFPIRVGNNYDATGAQVGYSGDFMSDQIETNWEQIGKDAEMPESEVNSLAEKERTTVTKKIRRVATQSWELLERSARLSGATKLILNFPQYLHWSSYKLRGGREMLPKLHEKVRRHIDQIEQVTTLPVVMIGTGPDHEDYIWLE